MKLKKGKNACLERSALLSVLVEIIFVLRCRNCPKLAAVRSHRWLKLFIVLLHWEGMLRFPHAHNTVKGQEGDVVTHVVTPLLT